MPGFNSWAQKIEDDKNHLKHLDQHPNTSKRLNLNSTKLKRSYDESEDPDTMEVENDNTNKEPRTEEQVNESSNVVSREHLLNFPLPEVASMSCIMKVLYRKIINLL